MLPLVVVPGLCLGWCLGCAVMVVAPSWAPSWCRHGCVPSWLWCRHGCGAVMVVCRHGCGAVMGTLSVPSWLCAVMVVVPSCLWCRHGCVPSWLWCRHGCVPSWLWCRHGPGMVPGMWDVAYGCGAVMVPGMCLGWPVESRLQLVASRCKCVHAGHSWCMS